jgi:hypothetical protein
MKKTILIIAAVALMYGCGDKKPGTGSVYGICVCNNDPAQGVEVIMYSTGTLNSATTSAITGSEGQYEFIDMDEGTYTIYAKKGEDLVSNFKDIHINAGKKTRLDIQTCK